MPNFPPEFEQMADEAMLTEQPEADNGQRLDPQALAWRLKEEFETAAAARKMPELRWLDDLRQYRGIYDAATMRRLSKRKRSRVFYRMTTTKVNTMVARLMDLLFPQRLKNWSVEPTPDPMLPDDILMQELGPEIEPKAMAMVQQQVQQLAMQNIVPDQLAMQKMLEEAMQMALQEANTPQARVRIAKDRAAAMERVIDDQLKECNANGQRRPSWQQNCREVVKSSCLYGMGILKGPLVEKVATKRFVAIKDEYGQTSWNEEIFSIDYRPYHEAVSIWDVFPDPGARDPSELRFVWQTHVMTDKDVMDLANFPGFDGETILKYLRENLDGDANLTDWETQVRQLNNDNDSSGAQLKNRFRVYERWGFLSGQDLAAAGANIGEDDYEQVYSSNIWMIGDRIIKAYVNPLDGIDIPYYFYPYQKDDTSFWPEGIAYALRTPQAGINAAVRAMQDNAGASSGPIYAINTAYLSEDDDPTEMQANRIFLFDKQGLAINQMFQAIAVPSCIEHNLTLSQFWQNGADEVSTPRFNSGDGNVKGAGETASGLSMLMGAANILLKDHIKDFDDCIVAPFIRAMFRWNMKWNERDDIKGDFEVVASGSQSLIAKEVRQQQVPALIQYMAIPQFAPYIRADKLLEVALEQTDLPAERILRSDEEAQQYRMEEQAMQAQANVQALVQELERQGLTPEQIQQQMLMVLGQMQASMQQQPQGALPQGGLPA